MAEEKNTEDVNDSQVQVEDDQGSDDSELRAEASRYGWTDKDHWRGNPDDWVDAATFVERGRQINPILKANNERLKKEVDDLRRRLDEQSISVKEFKKFQEEVSSRKEKEFADQIAALKAAKKEAIELGDGSRVVELDDQIDEVKAAQQEAKKVIKEEPQQQSAQPDDPVFVSWREENDWYMKDRRMTALANTIGDEIRQTRPNLEGRAFLDAVTEQMKEEMPNKFQNNRSRPSAVDSSTSGVSVRGKKKSYDNLPADAKSACDDFVRRGWMTKEEYVAKYDWQ